MCGNSSRLVSHPPSLSQMKHRSQTIWGKNATTTALPKCNFLNSVSAVNKWCCKVIQMSFVTRSHSFWNVFPLWNYSQKNLMVSEHFVFLVPEMYSYPSHYMWSLFPNILKHSWKARKSLIPRLKTLKSQIPLVINNQAPSFEVPDAIQHDKGLICISYGRSAQSRLENSLTHLYSKAITIFHFALKSKRQTACQVILSAFRGTRIRT